MHRIGIRLRSCGALSCTRQRRRLLLLLPVAPPCKLAHSRAPNTPTPSCPQAPVFHIDSNLFQGLRFLTCVYFSVRNRVQGSRDPNHSIDRPGGRPLGGGESVMASGAEHAVGQPRKEHADSLAHKQAHTHWHVRTRTPARPHTPCAPKTATPSCSGAWGS